MPKRPVGVILSAVALGLAAALLLLLAFGSLFTFFMAGHMPQPNVSATPPPPPAMMAAIGVASALFYGVLAAWAVATLVGLVRLKNWARISSIVIGAGVAFINLIGALAMFAMPLIMANIPVPPTANPSATPAMLHGVFIVMGFFNLLIAAIGVAFIVYFSLSSTREAFRPIPQLPLDPYAPVPLPHAYALEYYEAQPMVAAPPPPADSAYVPYDYAGAGGPIPLPPAALKRPVSITVLAILFFVGAACCIPSLLLSYPVLVCGFMITGWAGHLCMALLMLWVTGAGIGLLKLKKAGWISAMAYFAFGILNSVAMLLPSSRDHMAQYIQEIQSRASMGMPQPSIDIWHGPLFAVFIVPCMILGLALVIFAMVLLWRARWAFEPGALEPKDQAIT